MVAVILTAFFRIARRSVDFFKIKRLKQLGDGRGRTSVVQQMA